MYLQEHNNCHADAGCSHIHPCHDAIPWYPITQSQPATHPQGIKFHTIKKDVSYRFWNPVSNGLMQKVGAKVTAVVALIAAIVSNSSIIIIIIF